MKKVLLTGATGFIGRQALAALVEAGGFDEIHAVSTRAAASDFASGTVNDFDSKAAAASVRWHRADLLAGGQAKRLISEVRPTHLLHLAWYAEPGKYWTSPLNEEWLQASTELLRAFVEQGGERVVAAGTCAEYDWDADSGYCSESQTRLAPATLYGRCKLALYETLTGLARETGLSAAWGRIFFLYGAHEHPQRLVSSVIRALLKGEPARCTHGEQLRDFLYVRDVAAAFVALLESDVRGAVNIGSGEAVSLKSVVNRIGEKLDRSDLVRLGALPAPPGEPQLIAADVSRLRGEARWSPRYTLDAGLDASISWWREQMEHPA